MCGQNDLVGPGLSVRPARLAAPPGPQGMGAGATKGWAGHLEWGHSLPPGSLARSCRWGRLTRSGAVASSHWAGARRGRLGRAGSQRPGLIGSVETRLSDSAAGNTGGLFTSLPVGPAGTWDPLPRFQAPASWPSVSAARGGQAPPCCL